MTSCFDLHLHTSFSDGTDTPETLLKILRAAGISTFAVCDHDTADGCREICKNIPADMRFINGIEFSCKTEFKRCHILGLGIDIDNPEIIEAVEEGKKLRAVKLESRLNHLKATHGIIFTDDEIEELNKLSSVGKPHLAQLIVKHGLAKTIDEAIKSFLTFRGNNDRLNSKFAIDAIKTSGGIPVWAHPLGGEGERRLSSDEFEKQLELLINDGINGLECYYSRYNSEEIKYLVSKAKVHKLLISGGSDYHGTNKTICPGELNTDDVLVTNNDLTILNEINYSE